MILFKEHNVSKILAGEKTVTRRRGRKRWNIGSIHQAKTRLFGEAFARLRIVSVLAEDRPGSEIADGRDLDADGRREGFRNWVDFAAAWMAMHGEKALTESSWRIAFEVVKE